MFEFIKKGVSKLNELLNKPEEKSIDNLSYLEYLVDNFKASKIREKKLIGKRYYLGEHDILHRKKYLYMRDGVKKELDNVPNTKRIDNQYAKAVDQKVNYTLGKEPLLSTKNEKLAGQIKIIFNKKFFKLLKNVMKESLNCGVSYMYLYIDEYEKLRFKKINSEELKIIYDDDTKESINFALRLYSKTEFINGNEKVIEYVEVYGKEKLMRYKLLGKSLVFLEENYYITDEKNNNYSWQGRIPIIPFRYNHEELSLIERVKSLQDGINEVLSDYNNNMEADGRNSILILKNYSGTGLEEFKNNLATFGAIKVTGDGGVDVLNVEVDSENYKSLLFVLKNALIENARCFDAKDDRLANNPNQMNIQSMYADIDLDSNGIETEFKSSFFTLMEFVKIYLAATTQSTYSDDVDIVFNKDVLINESQVISDINTSIGLLSKETLIEQHPYISNAKDEINRIESEKNKELETQGDNYENIIPRVKPYGEK